MRPDSSKTSALYKSRTYLLTYLLTSYSLTYKTLTNLNSLISITRSLLNPIAAYIPEMPPLLSPLLAQSLKNTNHSFYHASPYSRTTFLFQGITVAASYKSVAFTFTPFHTCWFIIFIFPSLDLEMIYYMSTGTLTI